ncbi:hypothetical protein [Jeongeupia chitinilytica]|uniref:Lipoprotein n=1 Tax=Jeongeupia chitinilytica TaxID=1041641 RepID=A0ABQ3GW26_9NEIS|nr:hypothetical protein [Jeongeupia chitinilytica]GHD57943.1 hypothetical protein GCM10007350_07000 [Jeongeupia chitinilytica]
MKTVLAGLGLALALTGCTQMQQVFSSNEPKKLEAPAGQASVLVTLTWQAPEPDDARVSLVLRGPKGEQVLTAKEGDEVRSPNGPSVPGKRFVLNLTPGRYQLMHVQGSWHTEEGGRERTQPVWLPLGQTFTVAAGEVVYIGNVNVALDFNPSVAISNQAGRDFYDLVMSKTANELSNIQVKLPQAGSLPYGS